MSLEVEVYPGKPAIQVRRGASAPFGWWPAICIALVALIDRVEFNLLAGSLPAIQRELGFDDGQAGAIATMAAIAAVVLLLPAGRLADTRRRTWTVSAVVAVWSLLTLGTGLVGSYAALLGTRVALGAAGQLYNPPGSSLLGDLYPGPARARAFGIERMAYFAGLPIGVIAGGLLTTAVGWRVGFFVVAIPGIVIAALVLTIREPIRGIGDRLSAWYATGDLQAAPSTSDTAGWREQIRQLWRIRTLRCVVSGLSILFFGLGGLFFWMPSFYQREFGLDEAAAAAVGGGAGLVGILIGIAAGSWAGDRWHGRVAGWRVRVGGYSLVLGTLGLAGAVTLTSFVPQVTCFALANVGFAGAIANLTAVNADVVAASRRGLGFAVLQSVVTLGGALGPWLIGEASDATGSLRLAYSVVIAPLVIGIIVTLAGARSYEEDTRAAVAGSLDSADAAH